MRTSRALGLLGLVWMTSCVSAEKFREVSAANEKLQEQRADLIRVNADYQKDIARLKDAVGRLQPLAMDANYLREQKEKVESILRRFNQDRPAELPKGVTTANTAEGLAVRVEGQILFDSGSDTLSKNGEATLRQLIEAVRSHPGRVRIAGHTDTDPIVHSAWKTNMRLSVARALRVREFLVSLGLPAEKLSVAGYGEFDPVDPNDKAKNRRTEIVLLR